LGELAATARSFSARRSRGTAAGAQRCGNGQQNRQCSHEEHFAGAMEKLTRHALIISR